MHQVRKFRFPVAPTMFLRVHNMKTVIQLKFTAQIFESIKSHYDHFWPNLSEKIEIDQIKSAFSNNQQQVNANVDEISGKLMVMIREQDQARVLNSECSSSSNNYWLVTVLRTPESEISKATAVLFHICILLWCIFVIYCLRYCFDRFSSRSSFLKPQEIIPCIFNASHMLQMLIITK